MRPTAEGEANARRSSRLQQEGALTPTCCEPCRYEQSPEESREEGGSLNLHAEGCHVVLKAAAADE